MAIRGELELFLMYLALWLMKQSAGAAGNRQLDHMCGIFGIISEQIINRQDFGLGTPNLPLERLAELSWESQAEVLTELYSGLDVV